MFVPVSWLWAKATCRAGITSHDREWTPVLPNGLETLPREDTVLVLGIPQSRGQGPH